MIFDQEGWGKATVFHLDERGFEPVRCLDVAELPGDVAQGFVAGDAAQDMITQAFADYPASRGVHEYPS